MADPRTSVAVPPGTKRRILRLAKASRPPMGWTQKLVLLAEAELDRLDGKGKLRQPMPSDQ